MEKVFFIVWSIVLAGLIIVLWLLLVIMIAVLVMACLASIIYLLNLVF